MKTQEEAAQHNISRMSNEELVRQLRWLQDQEVQPPLRRYMIREMQDEKRRRGL